jgi:hypothetical protein
MSVTLHERGDTQAYHYYPFRCFKAQENTEQLRVNGFLGFKALLTWWRRLKGPENGGYEEEKLINPRAVLASGYII